MQTNVTSTLDNSDGRTTEHEGIDRPQPRPLARRTVLWQCLHTSVKDLLGFGYINTRQDCTFEKN